MLQEADFKVGELLINLVAGSFEDPEIRKKGQDDFLQEFPKLGIRRFKFTELYINDADLLNALGEAGWELVTMYDSFKDVSDGSRDRRFFYFKRPLE